jgi:hypothetical protein
VFREKFWPVVEPIEIDNMGTNGKLIFILQVFAYKQFLVNQGIAVRC